MFSKLFRFGQKKQTKKVHESVSDDDVLEDFHSFDRGLPALEKSQIRLLVYKDHDKRGDKYVLFDSKTAEKDDPVEKSDTGRPARKRVSSDVQLLGEMIFGSVEMTYKGPTVKAHSMRTPPQLLLTKVFALKPPRSSHGGSSTASTSNLLTEYSSSARFSESVSSVSSMQTSPLTSSDNEECLAVAKSVPVPSNVGLTRRATEPTQLKNIAEFSNSTSETSQSLTFPRTSSTYQRRLLRSQATRMEYGCMKRNENFSEEMSMRLRRRPKIGIGILFSLWEDKSTAEENNRLFQNFVFSHFPLFESHIHRLKRMVEKSLLSSIQMSGKSFQDALLNAANTFATNILNMYYAPRIRNPLWLTMLSQPDQCNTICDDLVPQIVKAVESYNTKHTNYFLASLLTAVLTYHVAWVTTVTPSSDVARRAYLDKHSSEMLNILGESNPYNPLWAQLSELYGACGDPTKMARTVIIGQDQQIVTVILHILSYFIRCSEVFEQPLEQSPEHLASYVDSLETKCETIVENPDECVTESCTKESAKITKSPESHNSKFYVKNPEITSENSKENCGSEFENCGISYYNNKNLEICRNSQTKCAADNVDFGGEDLGMCSTDFDSSVEVLKHDQKNSGNCFEENSKRLENCVENCESCAKNSQNSLQSSAIDSEESKLSGQCCVSDPANGTQDMAKNSKNVENCVEITVTCEKDSEICTKGCQNISKTSEKSLENYQSENSRNEIEKSPGLNSACMSTEDEFCERCKNLTDTAPHRTSSFVILDRNSELCNCNGLFSGNNKEHQLRKSFLRTSCCIKNTGRLPRSCLSANSVDENVNPTKNRRMYNSEKHSDSVSGSSLCVRKGEKILPLDRQSIANKFLSSFPFYPVCEGQLNFIDQDFAKDLNILDGKKPLCLCQDCEKLKPCCCEVVDTGLGDNGRCASCITVNSDDSSGISVQSFEGDQVSLGSLSIDSGLNEQCLRSQESLFSKCDSDDHAFTLELPQSRLDENFTEDEMSCKNSQDCQLFSFGRSLMAGYCDEYVPDFVLHGTDCCTEEQAKHSMQISLEQPVVDCPISESVIIMGNTDKWECTVKTLSKHRRSLGNHPSGVRTKKAERSTLVHNFLTSFCDLWELNMPPAFCLMHLEDKMKELYLRSKVVSEYILTQKYVTTKDLMSTFGYGECDLALIMSIVGVHSPLAISRLPLPS